MQKVQSPLLSRSGLSRSQVESSRRRHGANRFTRRERRGFFRQFLSNFGDPIIKILLVALALNLLVSLRERSFVEPLGIGAAVLLATLVSTLSEYGSESAFARLQAEASQLTCRVQRQEGLLELPITDVVVGDLVLLQAGEKIPADGILISGRLQVDQSPVNGESAEAEKRPAGSSVPSRWSPDTANQLFRGTIVAAGQGVLLVCRVGDGTLYGSLALELQTESTDSPLKIRLGGLAGDISRMGYTAAALIAFADLFNALVLDNWFQWSAILADLQSPQLLVEYLFHAALLAIAVVVVAVPEGLPMMITVVLSSNMLRMKRDHVMVRKMVGIETAGSLNILFTDKTGTLTGGHMAVDRLVLADGAVIRQLQQIRCGPLRELAALSCRCNNEASLSRGRPVGGNSTDRAILAFAASCEASAESSMLQPFDSALKFSCARLQGSRNLLLFKGAPKVLLPRCTAHHSAGGQRRAGIPAAARRAIADMTAQAMRVLVLATADPATASAGHGPLTLLGMLGLRDSLRPGVEQAVRQVRDAGIQTVMITGDNRETAVAVARECGILTGGDPLVLTSAELNRLSDRQLRAALPRLRVVARALPTDKSRLVRAAQSLGLVAGMTGDGINDAPALKLADVGFAMGSGTEVAKEAGDIVILDDNFASIAKAVLYGRTIFKSIRKFLVFQLTMNLSAVGISLLAPFIGIDTPVTVTQMLWINIIMDTLGGLAFAGEPPLDRYMREPPKARSEPILSRPMIGQILAAGGYTILLCTAFLRLPGFRAHFGYRGNYLAFMTAFFTLFIFCGICNAFNARTRRVNLLANLRRNPAFVTIMAAVSAIQIFLIFFGGQAFRTTPLPFDVIAEIILLASTVIPFDLARKLLLRRNEGPAPVSLPDRR